MTIHNLSDGNSVLNQYIAEIRDKNIQKTTCASAGTLSA